MNTDLWRHCSKEHIKDYLLSLELLGHTHLPEKKQLACLYAIANHTHRHYHSVVIAKRDKSARHLLVPDPILKKIQKNILQKVLYEIPVSNYAMAYQKGTNILSNAAPHTGKNLILKLDIEDFFPSIIFPMIYKDAFPGIYFPPAVRSILTHLCCYKDSLPQGAPTSPAISNLILKSFDEHIGTWCSQQQITYTRYCDDMTFSGHFNPRTVMRMVRGCLKSMGFTLNETKTQILDQGLRQAVTGITVNAHPQVSRSYRRNLLKEIYFCKKYGPESHLKYRQDLHYLAKGSEGIDKYLRSLLGKVNYVLSVNPEDQSFREAKQTVCRLLI